MDLIQSFKRRLDEADVWHANLTLKRHEFLKVAGTVNTNLYFINSGCVRLFFEDAGEEQVIRLGYEDNFIAALDSFITGAPSDIYIQAIKATQVTAVSNVNFKTFVESNEENMSTWIALLELLLVQQIEREQDILIKSPKVRYERVLKRSPQLFQSVPAKYIASYLRMTPETLSRLKKS